MKCKRTYVQNEWVEMPEEDTKSLDSVTIKSFSIHSMSSVIKTKLEMSSKQMICKITYKVDMAKNGKLLPVDLLRYYF